VRAAADDVIVTNGMQQAAFVLARVLLEPGSTVAVEDPATRRCTSWAEQCGGVIIEDDDDSEFRYAGMISAADISAGLTLLRDALPIVVALLSRVVRR
jgi:DNA-binding transcriptional MocR family regulator